MPQSRRAIIVIVCVMYSLIAGLYPFEFGDRLRSAQGLPWDLVAALLVPLRNVWLDDIVQNVVYFLPWGAIAYILLGSPRDRLAVRIIRAVLVGGALSITIEISQYFFSRHPSIFDVLANTTGTLLGALCCAICSIDIKRHAARFLGRAQYSRALLFVALIYGTVPLVIAFSMPRWFDFPNWDRGYTFQLANEASLDRPWLGRLYLAAVYSRALEPEEIAANYEAGTFGQSLNHRARKGLVAYYTFADAGGAEISDRSGYGRPLNLTPLPISHFRWLGDDNGIEIVQPAILASAGPAEKLCDVLTNSNELSIEVWMAPSSLAQNGPARIVSFSRDTIARNFTLGQVGAEVEFRLRTPVSGTNGTKILLRTADRLMTLGKSHIILTYKDGVERLYVDGRLKTQNSDLKLAEVIPGFGAKKNFLSQIAFTCVYFFPVSFILSLAIFARTGRATLALCLALTIAIALVAVTELFQAYNVKRTIDISAFGYGAVPIVLGAFCGPIFRKES